jgi:uncharacterized membrane protein YoaK (UPF0700 family)
MLRKYSTHRTHQDNLKLGGLTAFSAGMVNVISLIVFFAFTSNVTGHFAIFAQEIAKGNWFQAAVVLMWVLLFFLGSFTSNFLIIHGSNYIGRYLSHAVPLILETLCLLIVGIYLQNFYKESLQETEFLVSLLLFAMGLQNGLTASISNSSVKTTHLTGLTTDLAILLSMLTKKRYRNDKAILEKVQLLTSILFFYVLGGVITGVLYNSIQNHTFYIVCVVLCVIILYDYYKLSMMKYIHKRQLIVKTDNKKEEVETPAAKKVSYSEV